jgi:hypothetical protein
MGRSVTAFWYAFPSVSRNRNVAALARPAKSRS